MAKNDDKIKELMAKVALQKEQLGAKPRVSWKTNGIFKFSPTEHLNLNVVRGSDTLVNALAFLLEKNKSVVEAAKMLGVSAPTFKYNDYTLEDYVEDFKTRLAVIKYEDRKAQLEATEAKLSQLVSEEARTEMEIDKIEKLIG
jgi:hypothetical protein